MKVTPQVLLNLGFKKTNANLCVKSKCIYHFKKMSPYLVINITFEKRKIIADVLGRPTPIKSIEDLFPLILDNGKIIGRNIIRDDLRKILRDE